MTKTAPKPTLTVKAADAPFQMEWAVEAGHLQKTDRKRLWDALKVQLYDITNAFYTFSECGRRFTIMDPSTEELGLIEGTLARFDKRHELDLHGDDWPKIPLRDRLRAYLLPRSERRFDVEVPDVVKRGDWYSLIDSKCLRIPI